MSGTPTIVEYASPPTARRKIPTILWWFAADVLLFIAGIGYMLSMPLEIFGDAADSSFDRVEIIRNWFSFAEALFLFLLGWAACGWWRSRRLR